MRHDQCRSGFGHGRPAQGQGRGWRKLNRRLYGELGLRGGGRSPSFAATRDGVSLKDPTRRIEGSLSLSADCEDTRDSLMHLLVFYFVVVVLVCYFLYPTFRCAGHEHSATQLPFHPWDSMKTLEHLINGQSICVPTTDTYGLGCWNDCEFWGIHTFMMMNVFSRCFHRCRP